LWALAKKYKEGLFEYNDAKLDQEIKRQLIENAPPDLEALSVLAQVRARLVHDFLVINGFDAKRLELGPPRSTQSSMGYVPLEFTLTVFD
jgi:predicted DNA repair protein MutK